MSHPINRVGSTHRALRLGIILVAMVTLGLTCGRQPEEQKTADPRLAILEGQTKMLMILEAQQGFSELFKARFNPDNTQLLLGFDLQKWLQENKKSLDLVPEEIRTSIKNNQGAGLLIRDGLPGKNGGTYDVVYLRPPAFGIRRFFLTLDPDPCRDGNPATCENCTGCSGETSPGGIIATCVCTESCDNCRSCRSC